MSNAARVTSIDALREFREALTLFAAQARESLTAADGDIRRAFDWLEQELKFWQKEIYRRQDLVGQAKVALNRKKIERVFGRKPDITEEEKALRKAQARLQQAEDMVTCIRRWGPRLQHAVLQYEGPARQLAGFLDGVVPGDLALLERKVEALEAYLRVLPPTTAPSGEAAVLRAAVGPTSAAMPIEVPTPEAPATNVPHPDASEEAAAP